jgi:hypothetical protein
MIDKLFFCAYIVLYLVLEVNNIIKKYLWILNIY